MSNPYYPDSRPSRSVISISGAVTVAGIPQQITTDDISCNRVKITCSQWNGKKANCPNGGVIVVGGDGIVATLATRKGESLHPTQGEWFKVRNANQLWVDALDSGAKFHGVIEIHE